MSQKALWETLPDHSGRVSQTTLGGPPRLLWESLPEYSVQSTVQSTAWSKYSIEYSTAETLPDHSGQPTKPPTYQPTKPPTYLLSG